MKPVRYYIVSHARPRTLIDKTLSTLERIGVPPEHVRVLVAPEEQGSYEDARGAHSSEYARLVHYHQGQLGIQGNRDAALRLSSAETDRAVMVDDDVRQLVYRVSDKRAEHVTPAVWRAFVEPAFALAAKHGSRLWGIYPVSNPFFMKPTTRVGLSYIVGCLYGCTPSADPASPLRTSLSDKDDFERSLACYAADDVLVRFEWIAPVTAYWTEPGGLQSQHPGRPLELSLANAQLLRDRYPQWVKLKTNKSGRVDLTLHPKGTS